eukprot:jgi/Tetstr1/422426/TSEL_013264.t1
MKRRRRHAESESEEGSSSDESDASSDSSDGDRSESSKRRRKGRKKGKARLAAIREEADAARAVAQQRAAAEAAATAGGGAGTGPMTAEQHQRDAERVRKVYEPETGRVRLVKGSGEIVEQIVSREEQEAIRKRATMTSTSASGLTQRDKWTGREQFPSQHPWFGYK